MYKFIDKELEVCEYIIDSLDEDGYLRIEEKVIVDILKIDEEFFEKCLISV